MRTFTYFRKFQTLLTAKPREDTPPETSAFSFINRDPTGDPVDVETPKAPGDEPQTEGSAFSFITQPSASDTEAVLALLLLIRSVLSICGRIPRLLPPYSAGPLQKYLQLLQNQPAIHHHRQLPSKQLLVVPPRKRRKSLLLVKGQAMRTMILNYSPALPVLPALLRVLPPNLSSLIQQSQLQRRKVPNRRSLPHQ